MIYRLAIVPVVQQSVGKSGGSYSSLVVTTTATLINLVIIMVLNYVSKAVNKLKIATCSAVNGNLHIITLDIHILITGYISALFICR